jgi:hypothetical protein
MMTPSEEDFELELRSLPGVMSVGVDHRESGEVDAVTLFVRGQDPESVRHVALQVASLYYPTAAVTVEDANRAPSSNGSSSERVVLTNTDFNVHEGVSEVTLTVSGRTGTGRSGSGPLIGGAEATLGALRELGFEVPFFLVGVNNIATARGWPVIVTLRSLSDEGDRIGIAQSNGDLESAAKATLDALNRYLATLELRDR